MADVQVFSGRPWLLVRKSFLVMAVCVGLLVFPGCAEWARLPFEETTGPSPQLTAPQGKLMPTVQIAPATGWPEGKTPRAAPGLHVTAIAKELEHPRWLYVLPNGDVLVAETSAPERPENATGIKGWFMKRALKRAGSAVPSANRITLLRDTDGDGAPDMRTAFLENLNSPFGMALIEDTLYVANTDAVLAFPYETDATKITATGRKVADLPAGPINRHWTKNLLASRDGRKLYITVGSNSNAAEKGIDKEDGRALILELDLQSGRPRVYASGLRNPNGMGWEPDTGVLWTVVNERDELGSDLVPDYLTSIEYGDFYGWPWSYYGEHVDTRVKPQRPDMVTKAMKPDYALGAHVAALGLVFYQADLMPQFKGGAFIGTHGSWNRRPPSGYNVVFVPFRQGVPSGQPQVVLEGFLDAEGNAMGRPVGVAVDRTGALLVADDVGNIVWRITPSR